MALTSTAYSLEIDAQLLYWQPSETIDWAFTNNAGYPQQTVAFKTMAFDFTPGYRLGLDYNHKPWGLQGQLSHFHTNSSTSAKGSLTSAFMGGKLAEVVYQSGQVQFDIDFTMIEGLGYYDLFPDEHLRLRPLLGLQGGWINQSPNTQFQGQHFISERVKNNFSGIGPKAGIEGEWTVLETQGYRLGILAACATSYQWGNWFIRDDLTVNTATQEIITKVGPRDLGAFSLQTMLGLHLNYKNFSMSLGYEFSDWFNQYQVLDDATGAHNNDLVLQGLNLGIGVVI